MKRLRYENGEIDAVDGHILRRLAADARVSMAELAREVGLSAPSTTERVRRLEEAGVIKGYGAVIEPAALGRPLAVIIRIRPMPGHLKKVAEVVSGLEAVVRCDRVTGEDCYIAFAHLRDVAELEMLVDALSPFAMTNSSLVHGSPVESRLPPIEL